MDELIYQNKVPTDILIFKEDWCVNDMLDAFKINNKDSRITLIDAVFMIILLTFNAFSSQIRTSYYKKLSYKKHSSQETPEFWGPRREIMNLLAAFNTLIQIPNIKL